MEAKSLSMKYRSDQTHSTKDKHHPHTAINDTIWNDIVCHHTHKLPCYVYQWTQNTKHIKSTQPFYRSNILFIRSFGTCRIRRFLAVLRSFFHSSLLCTFSCHPSPPTIHPSSLTSSCHLFLGLPLNLVVPKFMYNTLLGILFPSILCTCPNQYNLVSLIVSIIVGFFNSCINFFIG